MMITKREYVLREYRLGKDDFSAWIWMFSGVILIALMLGCPTWSYLHRAQEDRFNEAVRLYNSLDISTRELLVDELFTIDKTVKFDKEGFLFKEQHKAIRSIKQLFVRILSYFSLASVGIFVIYWLICRSEGSMLADSPLEYPFFLPWLVIMGGLGWPFLFVSYLRLRKMQD